MIANCIITALYQNVSIQLAKLQGFLASSEWDRWAALVLGWDSTASKANKVSAADVVQIIQQFLSECSVDPKSSRLKTENCLGWVIQRGSASIYIIVGKNQLIDEVTLEIFSPILKLPKQNILPFYRRCLELNRYMIGCALCVEKDDVIVVAERQLDGLSYEELRTMTIGVANAADFIDDELAKEFGAQLTNAT